MDRRKFLGAASFVSLGIASSACSNIYTSKSPKNFYISNAALKFPKVYIRPERIIKETVGLRPFRASGPRLDTETWDNKTIVHNYGHGGSGWSLSWGTANIAEENVAKTGEKKIGVLGCGTVGLATARLLQERGYEVSIYTKELPPDVTSSKATGTWSPASRVCDRESITPEFRAVWEKACLFSFKKFQFLLGLNNIVSWYDGYNLLDSVTPANFVGDNLSSERLFIPGLVPERKLLGSKEHPFEAKYVTKQTKLMFNIPSYLEKQINDFLAFGGKIKIKEIKKLEDIDALTEKCIVNCMGLGAKAVFNDEELTPVSGQLTCLIPQPEVQYSLNTQGASFISRKDGIFLGGNGIVGNWDTTPQKEQTEKVAHIIQNVMDSMRA